MVLGSVGGVAGMVCEDMDVGCGVEGVEAAGIVAAWVDSDGFAGMVAGAGCVEVGAGIVV